jgi:anti-sigma regulatory factor (Ser/Thr protein kinase)
MTRAVRGRENFLMLLRQCATAEPDPLEATAPGIDMTGVINLYELRQAVKDLLAGSAAPPEKVNSFVFAVSEVATNALAYGRPPARARVWSGRDRFVCTVTDQGDGFEDALCGAEAPKGGEAGKGGRGLWLSRQMCDVVSAAKAEGGFTVRIVNHY